MPALSSTTTRKVHYILRGALERAVRWRYVGVNVAAMAEAPSPERTRPDPPSPAEAADLLSEAWSDPEWGLLLWLTMTTGCRRGELCSLRWRHLNVERSSLWVSRSIAQPRSGIKEKNTKTDAQRRIALDAHTLGLLAEHRDRMAQQLASLGLVLDVDAFIFSTSPEGMEIAKREIEGMTAEAEIGKIYKGRVVTVKEFGAFVEVLPGRDGLVHISELANFRVKQTEDIVKIGDDVWIKCLGVDEKGRVRLSRRAAMEERDVDVAAKEKADYEAKHGPDTGGGNQSGGERRESRGGDRDRGPRGGGDRGGDRGGRGPRDSRGGDRGPRPDFRGGGEARPSGEARPTEGDAQPPAN